MSTKSPNAPAFLAKLTQDDVLTAADRRQINAETRSDNKERLRQAQIAAKAAYHQCMMFGAERHMASVSKDKRAAEFASKMQSKAFDGFMLRMDEWSRIPFGAKYQTQNFISAVKEYRSAECFARHSEWLAAKDAWLDRAKVGA